MDYAGQQHAQERTAQYHRHAAVEFANFEPRFGTERCHFSRFQKLPQDMEITRRVEHEALHA
ncbi:MAG TPA: hypothetical protein VIM73_11535, partial [Polyangiaceae bacterium]